MTNNENKREPFGEEDLSQVVFPEWLAAILPEPREPVLIDYMDGKYLVKHPANEYPPQEFDTLKEANTCADDTTIDDKTVGGIVFSDNLPEVQENGSFGGMLVTTKEGELLIPFDDHMSLRSLKYSYKKTLEYAPYYEADPSDFMIAYNFIDHHPAFWIRRSDHRGRPNSRDPFEWATSGFAGSIWHRPQKQNDGRIVHMMETGGHVPNAYTSHFHDHRLDTYADSYENGIIETAALLHEFFYPDGTDREPKSEEWHNAIPVGDD